MRADFADGRALSLAAARADAVADVDADADARARAKGGADDETKGGFGGHSRAEGERLAGAQLVDERPEEGGQGQGQGHALQAGID